MSDDIISIEIDGQPRQARKGQMIIEVTDANDVYVPRFCYHEKLSIAANCRMCMVEVENVPKPLPACATPVADGMKVFTRSELASGAQRSTMEFLLINHPLDCPICDQGGECELQDLAMGFGSDSSRYTEGKRVIKDRDLGPLVSTDMTRCIYCTRCVRFTGEIAGVQELGTVGRGESTEVAAFVEQGLDHELSGNVIDLCPVGALNSKPYRYRARAWEMSQHPTIAPHDCVGSNVYAHVRRGQLMRVVPRANEQVNETWISDRDRFGYEGVYAEDRLLTPQLRDGAEWREVDWRTALEAVISGIQEAVGERGGTELGVLTGPSSTLEEGYLLAQLAGGLGCSNIDHRLRRTDFSDQAFDPRFPSLGMSLQDIESADSVLLIGSNLRKEAPMLAHRVRKAALAGARVATLNPNDAELLFETAAAVTVAPSAMIESLAAMLAALGDDNVGEDDSLTAALISAITVDEEHRQLTAVLSAAERPVILLGHLAGRHPEFGRLRALAAQLARATGATLCYVSEGANSAGLALSGVLPHRGLNGVDIEEPGQHAGQMLATPLKAYLLMGIEPELDTAAGAAALQVLAASGFVACLTPYVTDAMREYAHVLLPIGTFAETSGTYVNGEGRWQSFAGVATPVGESRPAWKVLRVLGNVADLEGFDYADTDQIRGVMVDAVGQPGPDNSYDGCLPERSGSGAGSLVEVSLYRVDPLVRRSPALQATRDNRQPIKELWV